ncbi:unnamed protein product, partial [Closterium sp. NIES-53]
VLPGVPGPGPGVHPRPIARGPTGAGDVRAAVRHTENQGAAGLPSGLRHSPHPWTPPFDPPNLRVRPSSLVPLLCVPLPSLARRS